METTPDEDLETPDHEVALLTARADGDKQRAVSSPSDDEHASAPCLSRKRKFDELRQEGETNDNQNFNTAEAQQLVQGDEYATSNVDVENSSEHEPIGIPVQGETAPAVAQAPESVSKRLTIDFLRWRFDLIPERELWLCPFPPHLHMIQIKRRRVINHCNGLLFDAEGVQKHIGKHQRLYKKANLGQSLPCPFRNNGCNWGAGPDPRNDAGYAHHVAQVHMRTGILYCPCGGVIARREHYHVVRHLQTEVHVWKLHLRNVQYAGLFQYPYVEDERLLLEQQLWLAGENPV